jgi:hypothetical protein
MLTEAAQRDRDAFERYAKDAGCGCHTHPPCSYCTHPGNPANQEEDESCWTLYTKDEALWYAICQMRRAAKVLDIASIVSMPRDNAYSEIYGKGLNMCADECEKVIDPEELRRMISETFPGVCPICLQNHNYTGCADPWHEGVSND